ncbi:MAG: hypothetical protein IPH75_05300 [bacterium]|nr:hypothetical protein [bacterium]
MMEFIGADTPMPISPYRDLKKQPLTPREEQLATQYKNSGAWDRAGALATHITTGAIGGLVGFFTGTLDDIVNPAPPKPGSPEGSSSPHRKIEEIATGLIDIIRESPDQTGHVAEVMFGTRNNPITKLTEGISAVLNAPTLLTTSKTLEDLRTEAINHFYEHPENLLFAAQMIKGKASIINKAKEAADLNPKAETEVKRAIDTKAKMDQDIARFQEELRIEKERATTAEKERDQAQQTIEKAVREKKVPVSIEEQSLGEVQRIQAADRVTLVNEIMDMQKDAKAPMTPEQVTAPLRSL